MSKSSYCFRVACPWPIGYCSSSLAAGGYIRGNCRGNQLWISWIKKELWSKGFFLDDLCVLSACTCIPSFHWLAPPSNCWLPSIYSEITYKHICNFEMYTKTYHKNYVWNLFAILNIILFISCQSGNIPILFWATWFTRINLWTYQYFSGLLDSPVLTYEPTNTFLGYLIHQY